jgi:hypothetical protein
MQLASAIAALLMVVPLLVLRLTGRRLDSRAYLAAAVPFTLVTLGVGGVLTLAVRIIADWPVSLEIFAVVTVFSSVAMLVHGALMRLKLLRFVAAVNELDSEQGREQRIELIQRFLETAPQGEDTPPSPHATRVMFAAAALCQVVAHPEAEGLLVTLSRRWLTDDQLGAYVNALAICRLNLGNVEGAREALDHAPEDGLNAVLSLHLDGLRALCASLSGNGEEALALMKDQDEDGTADLALLHTARAHAHAALGHQQQAEAELTDLVLVLGPEVLSFAIDIQGPASPIAEAVRATHRNHERQDADQDEPQP